MGSIILGIIAGAAVSYATDALSNLGNKFPTTAVYFVETITGLLPSFATYKILGSKIMIQMLNLIKDPRLISRQVWVAFEATRLSNNIGFVNNVGNDETSSVTSSNSYYSCEDDPDIYIERN